MQVGGIDSRRLEPSGDAGERKFAQSRLRLPPRSTNFHDLTARKTGLLCDSVTLLRRWRPDTPG